jgi:hypothetical protein
MALVRSVSAVQMRRWRRRSRAAPGCRRSAGCAGCAVGGGASTMQRCWGRGSSESTMSRSRIDGGLHVEGRSSMAAITRSRAGVQRGAGDLSSRDTDHLVDAALRGLASLPKPPGMPARFCSSSVTCSRMWPARCLPAGAAGSRRARRTPQRCSIRGQPGCAGARRSRGSCWRGSPPGRRCRPRLRGRVGRSRCSGRAQAVDLDAAAPVALCPALPRPAAAAGFLLTLARPRPRWCRPT